LREIAPQDKVGMRVLDLGCGEGGSVELFRRLMPSATWHGIDIESSPEVDRRNRQDIVFDTFDGIHLPYADAHFDLVYSNQVLEHVRYPDALLTDVQRVLKPRGLFIGGVSYLEPYHSRSIFNFTPYGLIRVMEDAGLELQELRPGIDSFSAIFRQLLGGPAFLNFLWRMSPMNVAIGVVGSVALLPAEMRAFLKIQYCAQFCFLARKAGGSRKPHGDASSQ
jgi:SAM-dependent methyltransferase